MEKDKKLYRVTKKEKGLFKCGHCLFTTDSRGKMLQHHNPSSPFYCKKRRKDYEKPRVKGNLNVIYLAAGVCQRLRPLTYKTNKCLVQIGEKTLIEHFLDGIAEWPDIAGVHIVIGHCAEQIKKKIGSRYKGISIKYLYNPFYSVTGAAQSLWLAKDVFNKNKCLIVEGDHFMDKRLLQKLAGSPYENCLLVDDSEELEFAEETIVIGAGGIVNKLAWDSSGNLGYIKSDIPKPLIIGEAVFVIKLGKDASRVFSAELEQYLLEEGPSKKEIPEVLNRTFKICDTQYISTEGLPWIEIDFPKDLDRARNEIYPRIFNKK